MSGASSGASPGKILVVDDTVGNLRFLMTVLSQRGYAVFPASDGELALQFVESTIPDLILLDIMMPGMDGYEVCKQLKADKRTAEVPVIFMTGLTEVHNKVIGFELGAVDYITKPFQTEEVTARVDAHLALRSMQKELEQKNAHLQAEIRERQQAEAALEKARLELEQRVEERTAELVNVNTALKGEIVERKRAEERILSTLREKEILLKEIHHRVKNNLQVISSLIGLQANSVADPAMREHFYESQNRVRSMALVHEKLYRSENLASIDFRQYLQAVTDELMRFFQKTGLTCHVDVERVFLSLDVAIPCGLIVNELVSNAFKHAFKGRETGSVIVAMRRTTEQRIELIVRDNGIGFPADVDFRAMTSMGMALVVGLTEQITGTIDLERNEGTQFRIVFPEVER